ncbi:MAG: hypothetical protein LBL58_13890 [Tannerellaceae bacterium]|jgi:hypothetical protein|nr:hypothetical protein [Tannerellaceae bacterium]
MEETNDIRYSVIKISPDGKEKIVVKIRLNDECKNGHQDFGITADIYEKSGSYWRHCCGGCCHDKILKHYPQFKMFADLHLSDYKGAPLYAVENGLYWVNEYKSGKKSADTPKRYLRITDEEFAILLMCEDKQIFWYRLYELGIVKRWEEEARKAIEYLESLTGKEFLVDSVKSQIAPLPVETKLMIEERIANNYYSPKNINAREIAAKEAKIRKRIDDLKEKAETGIQKIKDELAVHLYVIGCGFPDDNLIYYNHTNKAIFNWQNDSYHNKISQEEFIDFLNEVDYSKLPEGISFEIKNH